MQREEEELKYLNFFDICKESWYIIYYLWSHILYKIVLSLIIPLSCIFLANDGISSYISAKILSHYNVLADNNNAFVVLLSWTIKQFYFTFLLILSLLPVSAIVFTIGCMYAGKNITFTKVMSVVPSLWWRLMFLLLCCLSMVFVVNVASSLSLSIWDYLFNDNLESNSWFIMFYYMVNSVYIGVMWQLASVVSVMDKAYGVKALLKSQTLIRGKRPIASFVLLTCILCLVFIQLLFQLVVCDFEVGIVGKIGCGFVCVMLMTVVFLFAFVTQTVIYFVCKSYHHEDIDKSYLAEHLEAYLQDYVPLIAKKIQMEQFKV